MEDNYGRMLALMFQGCDPQVLSDKYRLDLIVNEACKIAKADVRQTCIEPFYNEDDGTTGYTIVKVLSESNFDLHTFPKGAEGSAVTITMYTCGDRANPELAISYLIKELRAKKGYRTPLIEFSPRDSFWQELNMDPENLQDI